MATYLELAKIEWDSTADPLSPPPGSTQQDVEEAAALLARVRMALLVEAESVLSGGVPSGDDRAAVSAVMWARSVVLRPATSAEVVLRLALASFSSATATQILGSTDGQIDTFVATIRAALAYGMVPNR